MKVTVKKGIAKGCITAPPSKSMAHRLLICAALAEGVSRIHGVAASEDVLATVDCLAALGASLAWEDDTLVVHGIDATAADPKDRLFCRESGSTMRFLIPIAALSGKSVTLAGAPQLMRRPMKLYEDLFLERGLAFSQTEQAVTLQGPLRSGDYYLPGDVSSQFVSGLLFALPLLDGDSRIRITSKTESRSYIDLTLSALRTFGVSAVWEDESTLFVRGSQRYQSRDARVEGDCSGAAFPEALNYLGGRVEVLGIDEDTLQGDRVFRAHFEALHAGTPTISLADCPDLGPILFALAAAKNGATFTDTRRLRIKESDRVATMQAELARLGATVTAGEDEVMVHPSRLHAPNGTLEGHGDHRVVMSLAVLLTKFGGSIKGAEAVRKSYPDFFQDLQALGIEVTEDEESTD